MSDSKKMNPVVHFEMPAEDMKRVSDFYTTTFGWGTQQMGAEYGDYLVVSTTESDDKGPKKPGAINGGFYKLDASKPDQNKPSVVIAVDDIKEHMKKVADGGGKILSEIMDIPGIGQYVSFEDTEGNKVGMLQPMPMA